MVLDEKTPSKKNVAPLKLYGQEMIADTWAMAKMNMIVHDMEGDIEIGDTMKSPKFLQSGKIKLFDRIVANPMWNQGKDELPYIGDEFFSNDPYNRFIKNPGGNADWAWLQHIYSCLKNNGRSATVLDTGAASRGSGNTNTNKEKEARAYFVDKDLVEGLVYLPDNLFYNTPAPGIIVFLNKNKQHKGKIFLLNASKKYVKGDPKNYIPDVSVEKIASTYNELKEVEGFSKFITNEEAVSNDYNISPSRYIHVGWVEEYKPVGELVEELKTLEERAKETDKELWKVLEKLGYE